MVRITLLALLSVLLIGLTGCSKYFTIGENKGYCEEMGCDYADAGICGDPYELYKERKNIKKQAYKNIDCSSCNKSRSQSEINIVYVDNEK